VAPAVAKPARRTDLDAGRSSSNFPGREIFLDFSKNPCPLLPVFFDWIGRGGDPLHFDAMYLDPQIRRAQCLTFAALSIGPRGRQVP
jgi:hypothetical protein